MKNNSTQNAKVWIDRVVIPTYQLLEDSINPMIDHKMDPYPYTLQNYRSNTIENIEHEAVILENNYLKLIVLPNLGGRLFSAFDKINNREIFYRNSVIKPRMIGTRGGWISGGIEFNFPISHSPTTMDRVNYLTKTYDDGSAAIEFGNIELISNMNWKVELRLYKDKAYIEQNVNLYNPTRNLNRFYFWTNAAVEFEKSVKLIYPFDWCINQIDPHYIKWPFYKGKDYSNASEVPYAYETFGKLLNQNFFGVYNMERQYGLVHYADRKVLKGAKFFTWGNDQLADSWNAALTDDDSKYLEIQSGAFETQKVYKFMRPHQQLNWSEYWYPVSNTNSFVHAGKELAVNFEIRDKGVEVIFYAAETIDNCKAVIKARGKTYTRLVNLECGKAHKEFFELGEAINSSEFCLDVYNDLKHLLSLGSRDEFNEEQLDVHLYEDSRVNRGVDYKEEILNFATMEDSFGKKGSAIQLYQRHLDENPGCTVTLNRLGNAYLKKGMLTQAEECFKKVLVIDNRNSEARFMMASLIKEKGNYETARRLFSDIACDSEYYMPSLIEFIKMNISMGFYKDAYDTLEANDNKNSYYTFLKSVALRKDSLADQAIMLLKNTVRADEYIISERFILGLDEMAEGILHYTKGDERVLLILALEYAELGLWEDADKLIGLVCRPGIKTRLLNYKVSAMLGKPEFENLEQVMDSSLDYVFINEKPFVEMLEKDLTQDTTGKADYLLGTYYHAMGRKNEAYVQYLIAYRKGLRYTVLLKNLSLICYSDRNETDEAVRYLKEDIERNSRINEDSLLLLYRIYVERQDLDGRRSLLPYMKNAENKSLVLVQLINALSDTGNIDEAINLLEHEEFENWEGVEASGECYKETIIRIAKESLEAGNVLKSLEYIERVDKFPKGLNFGNSIRSPLAKEHYYKGIIYSENRLEQKAVEEFKEGAVELDNVELVHNSESRKYAMKCLGELKKRV